MKKVCYSIFILMLIITSSACSNKDEKEDNIKEEIVKCSSFSQVEEGMNITTEYEIRYKGEYVSKTIVTDKAEIEDEDTRVNYRDMVNAINETYNYIDYYKTEVTMEGNVVKNVMEIDYENISLEGLRKVYPPVKGYINEGKVKKDDIIKVYEDQGAICEK